MKLINIWCCFFKAPSIKYVLKIFPKTNISNPLICTRTYAHVSVRIRGLEMLVFGKFLRTYLMDGP